MPSTFDQNFVLADQGLIDEFSEAVVLTDLDLPTGRSIEAIVDLGIKRERIGSINTEIMDPGFDAIESDIVGLEKNQFCTVRAAKYRVTEILPDGTGWARVSIVPDAVEPATGTFR